MDPSSPTNTSNIESPTGTNYEEGDSDDEMYYIDEHSHDDMVDDENDHKFEDDKQKMDDKMDYISELEKVNI